MRVTDCRECVHALHWKAIVGDIAGLPTLRGVADVRVRGAIGVVQLERPVDVAVATAAAIEAGVWLRPFRDLVYVMPPFVCTDEDIETIVGGVRAAVTACLSANQLAGATR